MSGDWPFYDKTDWHYVWRLTISWQTNWHYIWNLTISWKKRLILYLCFANFTNYQTDWYFFSGAWPFHDKTDWFYKWALTIALITKQTNNMFGALIISLITKQIDTMSGDLPFHDKQTDTMSEAWPFHYNAHCYYIWGLTNS